MRVIVRASHRMSGAAVVGVILAATMAVACGGSAPQRSRPRSPAPSSPSPALDVCADLALAEPYLRGVENHSISGERLVDGLGDSAAQLKDDVVKLQGLGERGLAAAIDTYDHQLTRLRIDAQKLEAAEATGGEESREGQRVERSLEHRVDRLHSLSEQLGRMVTPAVCPGG